MARFALPARVVVGLVAIAIGVALIMMPASVHTVARLTGAGVAVAGVLLWFLPRDAQRQQASGFPRIIGGVVLVLLGATIGLWPDAGAPWLATLVGVGLIVHGAVTLTRGFLRGGDDSVQARRDHRATAIIAGLAAIGLGVLTFTWPVLTLAVFRLGVGAWLVFVGVQALLALIPRKDAAGTKRGRVGAWARTIGASLSLLLAVGVAYGSAQLLQGSQLPVPGPFYTAPAELPDKPGQLIRSEPLSIGVPAGARAWRILYTTTHPDGSPAISSGTVLAPVDQADEPLPLLSISHGTTGVVSGCSPSLSSTPFSDGAGTALAEMVVSHGWAAVTSDYIGLGTAGTHPYLVGDAEARNVLDASRAVQQFDEFTTTTDTVVWGHSQGGQGALWTGQIAEEYAPELSVLGVAAFAPAADLFGLADADKNEVAGKVVSAYIASTWNEIYPELELAANLTPGSARGVEKIQGLCFNGIDVLAALLRGTQVPNQVFPDAMLQGAFGAKLKEQTPVGPFPSPVMVAQGLADPLVKPALQADWVTARCEAGDEIDYRTFKGLDHNSLVAADSPLTPQIVQWTLDRWAGEAPTPNCAA